MLGKTILHYEITGHLGRGGMGDVYRAHDTKLDRDVAIKFLPAHLKADPDARRRLLREARIASRLRHPNVVSIYAVESVDERDFIVMELIEGESLDRVIRRGPMPIDQIVEVGMQICHGLQNAHDAGVIHRDLKPANILLEPGGRVRLLDFGLARCMESSSNTLAGTILGTPAYMSPEQVRGEPLGVHSDIFSLGTILYEMVSGEPAFGREHPAATMYAIANEAPAVLPMPSSAVSIELDKLIEKCLSKHPESRFNSCRELLECLTRATHRQLPRQGPQALRRVLAVLPFEYLGPTGNEYFADGVTDEIITCLAKTRNLSIISRTSVQQYKGTVKNLRLIARELGATHILEGTVRWEGVVAQSRVRITAQLIEASSDSHLWAERYDAVLSDIISLQEEVASNVSRSLNLELTRQFGGGMVSAQVNPLAYDCYLRARAHFDGRLPATPALVNTLESLLLRALEHQPDFAPAHAWLGHLYTLMYWLHLDRTVERISKAKDEIDRALGLSPSLPEAHQFLARYYFSVDHDFSKAADHFLAALEVEPNNSWIMGDLGTSCSREGKWTEAEQHLRRAVDSNPHEAFPHFLLARCLTYRRRYEDAERAYDHSLRISPDLSMAYSDKVLLYLIWRGDVGRALQTIQRALFYNARWPALTYYEVLLLAVQKRFDEAMALLTDSSAVHIRYGLREIEFESLRGDVLRYAGLVDRSRESYERVRQLTEFALSGDPDDYLLHTYAGRALAALGDDAGARSMGERAINLMSLQNDAVDGGIALRELAAIYAIIGDVNSAAEVLDTLLSIPSRVSVAFISCWPDFDAIRSSAQVGALCRKYASEAT